MLQKLGIISAKQLAISEQVPPLDPTLLLVRTCLYSLSHPRYFYLILRDADIDGA